LWRDVSEWSLLRVAQRSNIISTDCSIMIITYIWLGKALLFISKEFCNEYLLHNSANKRVLFANGFPSNIPFVFRRVVLNMTDEHRKPGVDVLEFDACTQPSWTRSTRSKNAVVFLLFRAPRRYRSSDSVGGDLLGKLTVWCIMHAYVCALCNVIGGRQRPWGGNRVTSQPLTPGRFAGTTRQYTVNRAPGTNACACETRVWYSSG
jgi:hypothetical protein